MFCPECGADHHATERAEEEAERERVNAEIEIKRLETKRDIEVARIQAGAARDIAETEAEADVAHAEGVVEGMTGTLETIAGDPEPEEPPVVEVVADEPAEPVIEESAEAEPPEAEPVGAGRDHRNPWW